MFLKRYQAHEGVLLLVFKQNKFFKSANFRLGIDTIHQDSSELAERALTFPPKHPSITTQL